MDDILQGQARIVAIIRKCGEGTGCSSEKEKCEKEDVRQLRKLTLIESHATCSCLKLPIVVLLTGVNQSLKLRGMSSEDGKEPVGDGHTGHRGM